MKKIRAIVGLAICGVVAVEAVGQVQNTDPCEGLIFPSPGILLGNLSYQYFGSAHAAGGGSTEIVLTDNIPGQVGSVVYSNPVSLSTDSPVETVEFTFRMALGSGEGDIGADGMSFALLDANAIGSLPFDENGPGAGNSLVVSFDTWHNIEDPNDPDDNHIELLYNGSRVAIATTAQLPFDLDGLASGFFYTVQVQISNRTEVTVWFPNVPGQEPHVVFTFEQVPQLADWEFATLAFGARTGGTADAQVIADVRIEHTNIVDCNGNNRDDVCDTLLGTSLDCNNNGIPDECETDCNNNGIPDECDFAAGTSLDCNGNGIPDECDIGSGFSLDCNGNGIPDECDIASRFSLDCNGNGIPDECDITSEFGSDCNGNGILDECDIASGFSLDCNGNGIPDECSLHLIDCRFNKLPVECPPNEIDCNQNGVPDECEIASGAALDTNLNGVPDECEIIHNITQDQFYTTIQWALDNAENGDEITVAPGVYTEDLGLRLGGPVSLKSTNGAGVTTLVGDTDVGNLEGFTILGNVTWDHTATGTIDSCVMVGGGILSIEAGCIIRSCVFSGASGPAVEVLSSSCSITDSVFMGNGIGVSYANGQSFNVLSIENSLFLGNSTGGISFENSAGQSFGTITGCTVYANGGYGVRVGGTEGALGLGVENTVLWGNGVEFINDRTDPFGLDFVRFSHSLVGSSGGSGAWDTNLGDDLGGNLDSDPLFVADADPGADLVWGTADDNFGDARPGSGSPMIDAGNNAHVGAGILTDLGGNPRFFDDPDTVDTGLGASPIVDIGAYEYQGAPPCPADFTGEGDLDIFDLLAFLDAFNAGDPAADFTGEGAFDIFDLLAFLDAFNAGCP